MSRRTPASWTMKSSFFRLAREAAVLVAHDRGDRHDVDRRLGRWSSPSGRRTSCELDAPATAAHTSASTRAASHGWARSSSRPPLSKVHASKLSCCTVMCLSCRCRSGDEPENDKNRVRVTRYRLVTAERFYMVPALDPELLSFFAMGTTAAIPVARRVSGFNYAIRNIVAEARKVEAAGQEGPLPEYRRPDHLRVQDPAAHDRGGGARDARRPQRLRAVGRDPAGARGGRRAN